ncbi:nitrous oxide reductase family maturation protein NosD [Pseudonocardia sulfidoxydans]|uniref:right-handed parallel beta-helix repeat-containing protein n=1 Tax=Pseudonocardia sulfidoxydans TaxID=54011 RepID=UPI001FE5520A|nr:right-handed parallel beta-helix repeat-containing protein [Pseudonocardia sulfidoxydans]
MTVAVVLAVVAPATASAATAPRCGWQAAATELAAATAGSSDARARAVHEALTAAGIGTTSAPGCTETPRERRTRSDTTQGKGIDDGAPGGGRTLTVGSGGQYRDIAAAVEASSPGDTVEVSAGTYPGFAVTRDGAPGSWLTIAAAPGSEVVVEGEPGSGNGLVGLDGRSWVRLVGLHVRGSSTHGVYGDKVDHVVLRDCEVSGSADGGIVLSGGTHVLVDGCEVHGNNARGTGASNEAISIVGTTTFEVVDSAVHDNGEEGVDAKYEAADGVIHHNRVWDNRGPNIYVDSAHDITVRDNEVWGATEASKSGIGLAVEDWSQTRRLAGITISDNVVRDNAGAGIDFWVESSGDVSDVTVTGNHIGGNGRGGITFNTGALAEVTVRGNTFGEGDRPPTGRGGVAVLDNVTGTIPAVTDAVLGRRGGDR